MRKIVKQVIVSLILLAAGCSGAVVSSDTTPARPRDAGEPESEPLMPPVTVKKPRSIVIHGDERVDPYAWLQDKGASEVLTHLEAENTYAEAYLQPLAALRDRLYQEIAGRIAEDDVSAPVRHGNFYYYTRTEEGKQYPIHCRKQGSLDAEETVILDLNELAADHEFLGLGAFEVSGDGNLLAYTLDTTGFREHTLYVLDLRTGALGPEQIPRVGSVAWAADDRTLFYTVEDHAKRPHRLYRHQVGPNGNSDGSGDVLVLEEADERFRLRVWLSRSKQYLFTLSASHTATEARYLPAAEPAGTFQVMVPRQQDIEYYPDHRGDHFYIRTNDQGRNFRVVTAPVDAPEPANWAELLPHREEVMLNDFSVFEAHYAVHERQDGLQHIRIGDLASRASRRIELPEPVYAVHEDGNPELRTDIYRFGYESLTTPSSVFAYHVQEQRLELLHETPVRGGYDRTAYQTERIHATAADGARIPISLVYRKGMRVDGPRPLLLQGYGAYGFSYPTRFSPARVSLLDRGVVVAIAHVRGGGEMGKRWHDDGRMLAKKNTFTDFIAAAEHLIAGGHTARERLAISGRSAGGLLIGAVVNMRPELFAVALTQVPFVDTLNTMLDEDLPLTVGEFEEWGNPKVPEHYAYIKSYCPYTNIAAQPYPAMLVTTALNDSQVMYWEPAKYVARLREHTTSGDPVLFRINMEGGHGGSSGRYDKIREDAFDYAFLLDQLGIRE